MEKQNIYAKLYTDGSLILSSYDYTDIEKQIRKDYGTINQFNWETIDNYYVKNIIVWDDIILPYYIDFRHMDNVEKMDLKKLDTSHVSSMKFLFYYCSNLESLDLGNFNTSKVKDMSFMFYNCSKLKNLNITNLDTSHVKNMSRMFDGCSSLENIDLTSFNTSRVEDMSRMFFKCSSLKKLDLTNFNTSNVTNMNMMFYNCSSLENIDLASFNTSCVEDMSCMFNNCSNLKNLDVTNFDTSNVKDMRRMFYGCSSIKNIDLTNFDTSNVTSMSMMFYKCLNLNSIYTTNFDTSSVTEMYDIFKSCSNLKNVAIKIRSNEEISELIRKQEEELQEQERIRKEQEKIKREEIKKEKEIIKDKNKKEKLLRENMIIDAYKKGQSIKLITENYNISHNTVKNILVRNGIEFRYDITGKTSELNGYYKKLYEWLEKNNILFKPNDRTTLKVSVDALLLGDYSNIAIHIFEKPKYMSQKEYERDINLKINKSKEVGLNILFLKKEDFRKLDDVKEMLDNLKLENKKNFQEFKGIAISKKDINKYQKLYYALAIKDVFSKDISELEYSTGKYLDIDEFEDLIECLPEKWEKVYRYHKSLDGKKYTNIEIGKKVGISEQQVKRIIEKLEEDLTHPYIKRNYENKIIRYYKNDSNKIEEYNNEINNLKLEIEDLAIINDYFLNTSYKHKNIEISKLSIDKDKMNRLKEEKLSNIQDLIQKYDNKLSSRQEKMYIYELNFTPKVNFHFEMNGIKTLNDLININENELYGIRTFGKNTIDEIINKLSKLGLHMKYSINELDFLSTRAELALRRAGIRNLNDVLNLTKEELLEIDGLGRNSYDEVINKIEDKGLRLKNGAEINTFKIEYWDRVIIKWESMMECFKNSQKFRLKELENSINERYKLIANIKEYDKTVKQYSSNAD